MSNSSSRKGTHGAHHVSVFVGMISSCCLLITVTLVSVCSANYFMRLHVSKTQQNLSGCGWLLLLQSHLVEEHRRSKGLQILGKMHSVMVYQIPPWRLESIEVREVRSDNCRYDFYREESPPSNTVLVFI